MNPLPDDSIYSPAEAARLPAQSLAYIGDAVYELYVREEMLKRHKVKSGKLHYLSVHYVKAKFQAEAAVQLLPSLSERERNILLRGRNADPGAMAKHASPQEYRWASGLETLIGYLYLAGEKERLRALLPAVLKTQDTASTEAETQTDGTERYPLRPSGDGTVSAGAESAVETVHGQLPDASRGDQAPRSGTEDRPEKRREDEEKQHESGTQTQQQR